MRLSIVIPTLKRDSVLLDGLKKLESQYFDNNYEIVIVSQAKFENDDLIKYIPGNKRIRLFEQFDKRGASTARNEGIRQSKGDVILFLDDDSWPLEKDLLIRHLANYDDTSVAGVVGKVVVDDGTIPSDNRGTGQVSKSGEFIDNWMSDERAEIRSGISCNLSVRRSVLNEVGGFDENYLPGMREDSDLTMRITRKYKMFYDPTAGVFHAKVKVGGGENRGDMKDRESAADARNKRLDWYQRFFHNEILFFLKHLSWIYLPVFVFVHKLRPILACMFWYGKATPKGLISPWKGMFDGYRTYRKEISDKSKWL